LGLKRVSNIFGGKVKAATYNRIENRPFLIQNKNNLIDPEQQNNTNKITKPNFNLFNTYPHLHTTLLQILATSKQVGVLLNQEAASVDIVESGCMR
jgi:hypothetical protein